MSAKCTAPTPISNRYDTKGVDFGSKFISEIMDASEKGEGWASKIMEADRQQVPVHLLNPRANTHGNLYGALRSGVNIQQSITSKDPTVVAKLEQWAGLLAEDFPALNGYTPQTLGARAANLLAVAKQLRGELGKLCSTAEVTTRDANHWTNVVDALETFGNGAKALHDAVCAGPDIKSIELDTSPRRH